MNKATFILFIFLAISPLLRSQVLPKEGKTLNYRLIGFSVPKAAGETAYTLEIATGYYHSEDSFKKNIIKTINSNENRIITTVPSFSAQYTWRITTNKKPSKALNELYHFKTGILPNVDTSVMRLRILEKNTTDTDLYVFTDGNKVLYDRTGSPLWYLPNIEGLMNSNSWVRDLKLTPQGTITFLLDDHRAYEISYDGDILWKGPNNNTSSEDTNYHHELTRISNGHYMALTTEPVLCVQEPPSATNKALYKLADVNIKQENEDAYRKFPFEVLTEYDEKGNVLWKWKLVDYFKKSDLYYYRSPKGKGSYDVRVNAFYFDEASKMIYISFKNISRVIKIKYPGKAVVNTYGEIFKPGVYPEKGNELFCHQHGCRISKKGDLYLFNNGCTISTPPSVSIFQQPVSTNGQLKKIWEYACSFDGYVPPAPSAAGNVIELPGNSWFVCMGTPYSKVFIVDSNKNIIWSALPEKWDAFKKRWEVNPQYRTSIINYKQLEHLIYNQ